MNPGNDHPEIPSFKPAPGKEEEKKGTGIVPSSAKPAPSSGFKFPGFGGGSTGASKAFSAPNLKVRGLSGGGSTVMDRLKNLRKKDLIFIAAGLCTLGMAPLAEHLLMSPDDQSAKLQEGFNSQQGPLFQDGSSVYEPGNGVGSPGGLVGSGADVITPLNVRDPSNLIMSPGASKKADAVVAPPPTPSAAPKDDSDWKNALSGAARSGASKAAAQAPRPRPNVGKMAGAIRGLSALGGGGGGTGASLKLDPLSARGVPNSAAGSNALTRSQATPGFRGATTRSGTSSGAGEDLRAAGAKQSDIFNRGGGAGAALDSASREAIPTGGAGSSGGRPGEGGETKNPGGNSQKDNKSLGESLAFLRQKMEMEKSLDLKWEKKKWKEFGRQKMMEESALKLGFDMFGKFAEKAFIGPLGDAIGQAVAGGGGPTVGWECTINGARQKLSSSQLSSNGWKVQGGMLIGSGSQGGGGSIIGTGCTQVVIGGGDSSLPPGQTDRRNGGVNAPGSGQLGERGRQNADAAGRLREQELAIAGWKTQIQQACSTMGTSTPDLVALKEKVCALGKEAESIEKALGDLRVAREKTGASFDALGVTATELGKEATSLKNSTAKLTEAAKGIADAYTKLRIIEGKEDRTDAKGAGTDLTTARTALGVASNDQKTSQAAVAPANKGLVDAGERAREAQAAADAANGKLGGQLPPAATGDQGTTSRYTEYRAAVAQAQTSALESHRAAVAELGRLKTATEITTDARNKFHGTAQAPVQGMENPREATNEVQGLGAMGTTYNNFSKHQGPLAGKADADSQLVTASNNAFTEFQTQAKTCTDAATRATCVAEKVTAYHTALDKALPGQQANASSGAPVAPMVAENSARASAAVQDFTAAYNRLRDAKSAAPGTGGPGGAIIPMDAQASAPATTQPQ